SARLCGGVGSGGEGPRCVPSPPRRPAPPPPRPPPPLGTVLVALLRAAIPQDPVALRRALRALHPVIDDVRPIPPARVRLAADLAPRRRVPLQIAPEPSVLRPRPRQHPQESSLATRYVAGGVARAELAVGHIQEVGMADPLAQEVPRVNV